MSAVADTLGVPRSPLSSGSKVAYAASMSAHPDDSALMLRYQDGDVSAFETLYRRHNDVLYRYLLRLCRSPDTAEDLYQETWSKIIRSRDRYRPTAKFTTFLFRVAHNCFIDYTRRNKRHLLENGTDPDETAADASHDLEFLTEKSLAKERLESALRALPDEQRDVFLLHEEAGLDLDAIAHVVGVNRETTKSRLRYAVNKLKLALSDPALQSERIA